MSKGAGWSGPIESYVADLIRRGHIRSERVAQAFRRVRRHRFLAGLHTTGGRWIEIPDDDDAVPDDVLSWIYSDRALATRLGDGRPASSMTAPAVMAEMLEALELEGGERVLEIGTGTGYNAALLAEITGTDVVTIDDGQDIAERARAALRRSQANRVTVVAAEGFDGHPDAGPYDRVIATVGVPGVAEPWIDQLALDGFVVAPVELAGSHPVVRVKRGRPLASVGRGVCWAEFAPGRGALAHRTDRNPPSHRALPREPTAHDGGPPAPPPLRLPWPSSARRMHSFKPELGDAAYDGLHAYVSVADRRARSERIEGIGRKLDTCVVRDGNGATAVFLPTEVVVDGPDPFAHEMLALVRRWRQTGSPHFTRWRCALSLDRRPPGRFWLPHSWEVDGSHLLDSPTTDHREATDPDAPEATTLGALGESVLSWLVDVALDAVEEGLRSALHWQVVDLAGEDAAQPRPRPITLSIIRLFDSVADTVEGLGDLADNVVKAQVTSAVRKAGAPRWAAVIAGQAAASIATSPFRRPLRVTGLVLRITGHALEVELERHLQQGTAVASPAGASLRVRQLLATKGFREELRLLVTEDLRAEILLLVGPAAFEDQADLQEFIAGIRAGNTASANQQQGHRRGPSQRR